MYWLWIPAVSLLSVFLLALCWYFFSDYTCCPCKRKRYPQSYLPTTVATSTTTTPTAVPSRKAKSFIAPSAPLQTPEASPLIKLKFGDKKLHNIIFDENGIPTIDLHGMTVLEARCSVQGFIQRQRSLGTPITKIITGKGIHSAGEAKVKPAIRNILIAEGVNFRETNKGGAYLINLY